MYGTVAAGYLTADSPMTAAPFGVNLFMPSVAGDPAEIATYAAFLQPEAERFAVALGEPRCDDEGYDAGWHSAALRAGGGNVPRVPPGTTRGAIRPDNPDSRLQRTLRARAREPFRDRA